VAAAVVDRNAKNRPNFTDYGIAGSAPEHRHGKKRSFHAGSTRGCDELHEWCPQEACAMSTITCLRRGLSSRGASLHK